MEVDTYQVRRYLKILFVLYKKITFLFTAGGGGGGCVTKECKYDGLVFGGIVGGIVSIAGCIFLIRICQGRPLRSHTTFIKSGSSNETLELESKLIFQSGTWISRYFQYGRWHGSQRLSLKFDAIQMKVSGAGSDDVGSYTITGLYSPSTQRLALTKKYTQGTGNPSENLGHSVTIQLYWNPKQNQFEGKWYVRTSKYGGENKFELKFSTQTNSNAAMKV